MSFITVILSHNLSSLDKLRWQLNSLLRFFKKSELLKNFTACFEHYLDKNTTYRNQCPIILIIIPSGDPAVNAVFPSALNALSNVFIIVNFAESR